MSGETLRRQMQMIDDLQRVVQRYGLDPQSALGALAQVAARQVEAAVMNDAETSGLALGREALYRKARNVVNQFSSSVLTSIRWTIRE